MFLVIVLQQKTALRSFFLFLKLHFYLHQAVFVFGMEELSFTLFFPVVRLQVAVLFLLS